MKISFDAKSIKTEAVVVFTLAEGKMTDAARRLDQKAKGGLKRMLAAEKFAGKKTQMLALPGISGFSGSHAVVIGLGKPEELTLTDFEKMGSSLVATLNARKVTSAEVVFNFTGVKLKDIDPAAAAARMAQGAQLSSYRFDKYMTKMPKDKKPTLKSISFHVADAAAAKKAYAPAQKIADSVFLTRDLVSEAPNVLYPESFANIIAKELAPMGVDVKVLHTKDLQKENMNALLAVGMGSVREPKLVVMQYNGGDKNQRPVAFVGKGVTFDTGGISIKPGPGMEDMKYDMAGAGVVTGLMRGLAARGAKVNAIGIVALAENMPSGNAYRPGDIITSMSGQTIEVQNTDAEGRVILCDALWYVQQKFKPTHIIDLATLTGAVIIALGHEYGGLFSNDDQLAADLDKAGMAVGENLWRLPLNATWDKAIDSVCADMKNISGGRDAGSAIGAHFLKRFIKDGVKWAHLDIAGVAWSNKDRPSVPKGASAFGLRLLDQYVADVWEKQ